MFKDKKPFFYIEDYDGVADGCYQDMNLLTQDSHNLLLQNGLPIHINKEVICKFFNDNPLRTQRYVELLTQDNQKLYA